MRLHIARQLGFSLECPDIGTYLLLFGYQIGAYNAKHPDDVITITASHRCRDRIAVARNKAVQDAKDRKATHLLMIDPDIAIDRYVLAEEPWAKLWWPTLRAFATHHPNAVLAAPYAGMGTPPPVHVFDWNVEGKPCRVPYEEAAERTGWQQVAAVGTGLMFIPMDVFDRMTPPYFDDVCSDESKTRMAITPDLYFSLRCRDTDTPIYVNWDCWCGHWQNQVVESPRCVRKIHVQKSEDVAPDSQVGRQAKPHSEGCVRELRPALAEEAVCHEDTHSWVDCGDRPGVPRDDALFVGAGL